MNISDIGLIGLAVMGENLALNFESKGLPYLYITGCIPEGKIGLTVLSGDAGLEKILFRPILWKNWFLL